MGPEASPEPEREGRAGETLPTGCPGWQLCPPALPLLPLGLSPSRGPAHTHPLPWLQAAPPSQARYQLCPAVAFPALLSVEAGQLPSYPVLENSGLPLGHCSFSRASVQLRDHICSQPHCVLLGGSSPSPLCSRAWYQGNRPTGLRWMSTWGEGPLVGPGDVASGSVRSTVRTWLHLSLWNPEIRDSEWTQPDGSPGTT